MSHPWDNDLRICFDNQYYGAYIIISVSIVKYALNIFKHKHMCTTTRVRVSSHGYACTSIIKKEINTTKLGLSNLII